MFPKVYNAGVESSGAVKDVTGLICLPVQHSGHLARVAGRHDHFSFYGLVGSASASQAVGGGFESRLCHTLLRRRKVSRCLAGLLFK